MTDRRPCLVATDYRLVDFGNGGTCWSTQKAAVRADRYLGRRGTSLIPANTVRNCKRCASALDDLPPQNWPQMLVIS